MARGKRSIKPKRERSSFVKIEKLVATPNKFVIVKDSKSMMADYNKAIRLQELGYIRRSWAGAALADPKCTKCTQSLVTHRYCQPCTRNEA